MNDFRLTFTSSTNLTLPVGVYHILSHDALHFGFIKNGQPNMSGFINQLVPSLSDYQEDFHKRLLKYNSGNEELTKAIEKSIYNVYLSPFNFSDDATLKVPFRVNQQRIKDFYAIHDVKLSHYGTNFTKFIRSLLTEYATKSIDQREVLYAYSIVKELEGIIKRSRPCHFYCKHKTVSFIPISIEVSPITRHNVIAGITLQEESVFLNLSAVQAIHAESTTVDISDNACEKVQKDIGEYFEKEAFECLD